MEMKCVYEAPAVDIREFSVEAGIAGSPTEDGMSVTGNFYYDGGSDDIDF